MNDSVSGTNLLSSEESSIISIPSFADEEEFIGSISRIAKSVPEAPPGFPRVMYPFLCTISLPSSLIFRIVFGFSVFAIAFGENLSFTPPPRLSKSKIVYLISVYVVY